MLKTNMKPSRLSLLFVSCLLIGCTSNGDNKPIDPKDNGDYLIKEDTSIDFLCMANKDYYKYLNAMLDSFKEEEPHVKVNLYNPLGSGNYNAIERVVVSGFFKEDYPDIVQCYPDNVVKYLAQGYAVNIDDYLNNEVYGITGKDKEDYISTFMDEGSRYLTKGTYSLPFCKSTELLYYNADALIGLNLSDYDSSINNGNPIDATYLDSLTWEELFNVLCPAIYQYNEAQSDENKIYDNSTEESAIFTYDSDENFFITLAHQYGYGYTSIDSNGKGSIDFNNDEMKGLLKGLRDAKANKYLQTKGTYLDYVSELFVNKKALFTVSSTASLSYNYNKAHPFEIGVARIPHPEGKGYSAINQGPSVCILDHKDSNRSLASYLLWKHITNASNSSYWSLATGYMGIRDSSYHTPEYIEAINVEEGASEYDISKANNLIKIREVKDYTFNTPTFRGSSNARTDVGFVFKEVLLSDGATETINNIFAKYEEDAKKYCK